MLLNNIFSCALADSARLNLVFMSNISILLILFFGGQVDHLQNELEREDMKRRAAHPFGMAAMLRAPASSVTNFTVSRSGKMNYVRKH